MNSEEKFKDLLKKKLASREFSVDEDHWDAMRTMIDAAQAKQKRRAPLAVIALLLVITGGIGVYFFAKDSIADNSMAVHTPSHERNHTQAVTGFAGKETPHLSTKQRSAELVKATAGNDGIQSGREVSVQKNTMTAPETTVVKASEARKHTATALPATPKKQETNVVILNAPQTTNIAATAAKQELNEKTDEPVAKAESAGTSPASMHTENESKNEPAVIEIRNTEPVEMLGLLVPKAILPDSVKPAVTDMAMILPGEVRQPGTIISAEAGANFLLGWKTNGKRDAQGLNPLVGLNYFTALNSRVGISAGLHYTWVQPLSSYSHTSSVTRYGFGEQRNVTIISPEKIHYLQLPFRFSAQLNSRNTVGLGYTFGYLLTVKSKVQTYTEINGSSTSPVVSSTRGYVNGFNKYDSQLSVFYRRRVARNFYVNAELLFGLADIKSDSFFRSPLAERNSGAKVSLIYTIFQK